MSKKKKPGGALKKGFGGGSSVMDCSPAAKARYAKKLKKEEQYWASLAGPVTVTKVGDQ